MKHHDSITCVCVCMRARVCVCVWFKIWPVEDSTSKLFPWWSVYIITVIPSLSAL